MAEQVPDAGQAVDVEERGGDAACWAHLVCPECGRLNDRPADGCEACGAPSW